MTSITLHAGDNRIALQAMIDRGEFVDSCVTDAPYGLVSITKRFGKTGSAAAQFGSDGAFARASKGFMGSVWDGTGIERDPEFWRLVYDVLKPGGYVVAFGGSRTGHRTACAIEDAGFVMHPMKGWLFGQGMPKASNAQRAIDCHLCPLPGRHYESVLPREPRDGDHICPPSHDGVPWEGWAYGGAADKPALEPIFVGQKPFSEKNGALNLLKHGVGAINIDACRVHGADAQGGEYEVKRLKPGAELVRSGGSWRDETETAVYRGLMKAGRHPANLLHDGSDEVVALFPQSAGQIARSSSSSETRKNQNVYGKMQRGAPGTEMEPRNDTGSAARFFNSFPPDGDAVKYHGKATKADRAGSKHPTVKAIGLMEWLVTMVTPVDGTVLDPFAGSGTTGQAALNRGFDCILMEAEPQFIADIRTRFNLPGDTDDFDALLSDDFDALLMDTKPEQPAYQP